ncbi:MAG TPA: hypothetical protein DDW41_00070 [Candidatus Andersenbacteria bacterium]|nr:hypothetical protein [Candidatus Andersenbacteria bacterium]
MYIHPFPARMAPEIALKGLENLPENFVVLDPMSGSGMVLGTAAKLGLSAIGYDLDPLACMISRANGTSVNETKARRACEALILRCYEGCTDNRKLPWIDEDEETRQYINYWFAPKQQEQLRALSYHLVVQPISASKKIAELLRVAVSRLIITKDPKASLARDTAHSRPHRTITENDFDILNALPASLEHVLSALKPNMIVADVKTYRGDARRMGRIPDLSIDCIVTSPPYLNAIDYMRGHKLSLVWLGFSVSELRRIRSRSVGAEIVDDHIIGEELGEFLSALHPDVDQTKRRILKKYYRDLCSVTDEAYRVLRPNRMATYVIGNSNIKGHEIRNSDLLITAAKRSGFRVCEQTLRVIPENKRYMPLVNSAKSNLANRMRTEHVVVFAKT